jgi:hypothetical protein
MILRSQTISKGYNFSENFSSLQQRHDKHSLSTRSLLFGAEEENKSRDWQILSLNQITNICNFMEHIICFDYSVLLMKH